MATDDQLPSDATIISIAGGLKDPESYVRAVLANLRAAGADTFVRISVRNGASFPDYIVDQVMDDETRQIQPLSCFNGKTHRRTTYNKFNDEHLVHAAHEQPTSGGVPRRAKAVHAKETRHRLTKRPP